MRGEARNSCDSGIVRKGSMLAVPAERGSDGEGSREEVRNRGEGGGGEGYTLRSTLDSPSITRPHP